LLWLAAELLRALIAEIEERASSWGDSVNKDT
jgi:hypothetical protein